jgi:hypothetical protein
MSSSSSSSIGGIGDRRTSSRRKSIGGGDGNGGRPESTTSIWEVPAPAAAAAGALPPAPCPKANATRLTGRQKADGAIQDLRNEIQAAHPKLAPFWEVTMFGVICKEHGEIVRNPEDNFNSIYAHMTNAKLHMGFEFRKGEAEPRKFGAKAQRLVNALVQRGDPRACVVGPAADGFHCTKCGGTYVDWWSHGRRKTQPCNNNVRTRMPFYNVAYGLYAARENATAAAAAAAVAAVAAEPREGKKENGGKMLKRDSATGIKISDLELAATLEGRRDVVYEVTLRSIDPAKLRERNVPMLGEDEAAPNGRRGGPDVRDARDCRRTLAPPAETATSAEEEGHDVAGKEQVVARAQGTVARTRKSPPAAGQERPSKAPRTASTTPIVIEPADPVRVTMRAAGPSATNGAASEEGPEPMLEAESEDAAAASGAPHEEKAESMRSRVANEGRDAGRDASEHMAQAESPGESPPEQTPDAVVSTCVPGRLQSIPDSVASSFALDPLGSMPDAVVSSCAPDHRRSMPDSVVPDRLLSMPDAATSSHVPDHVGSIPDSLLLSIAPDHVGSMPDSVVSSSDPNQRRSMPESVASMPDSAVSSFAADRLGSMPDVAASSAPYLVGSGATTQAVPSCAHAIVRTGPSPHSLTSRAPDHLRTLERVGSGPSPSSVMSFEPDRVGAINSSTAAVPSLASQEVMEERTAKFTQREEGKEERLNADDPKPITESVMKSATMKATATCSPTIVGDGVTRRSLPDDCAVIDVRNEASYRVKLNVTLPVTDEEVDVQVPKTTEIVIVEARGDPECLDDLVELSSMLHNLRTAKGRDDREEPSGVDERPAVSGIEYRWHDRKEAFDPAKAPCLKLCMKRVTSSVALQMRLMCPETWSAFNSYSIPVHGPLLGEPFGADQKVVVTENDADEAGVEVSDSGKSPRYDVYAKSEACPDLKNWYLVFPRLSLGDSNGVAVRLTHGTAASWDARLVQHYTTVPTDLAGTRLKDLPPTLDEQDLLCTAFSFVVRRESA